MTSLPTTRQADRPFDPPTGLAERGPLSRLRYADGHEGWLVTSHALAREVLADARFSIRPELQHKPIPGIGISDQPPPPGMFAGMDAPEHTRYRRLLTGEFTVRRMRLLTEQVQKITDEHLDAMARTGGPADLVAAWAQPIPTQVMCELLGVPYEDRVRFSEPALELFSLEVAPERKTAAFMALRAFIGEQIAAKRAVPADDLLTGLTTSDLSDEELITIGFTLLGAGLDTTANMLSLGTFALLSNPGQLATLHADPDSAVEELLRYLSIAPFTLRTALAEVELNGEHIKAGETVTVSITAANRDPAHFADPGALDLSRRTGGHVAFGHGIHQCLGQQLARVELRVALPALFTRFPTLRLAVPAQDVALRSDMLTYGVHALPVTWEA